MKYKPIRFSLMQFNLVVLLALFQFFIPSTLYAEEFCSSPANSTLLVAQNIDGDFRASDSSITLDSFQ